MTLRDLTRVKVAVPGTLTTAFLTLKLLFDSLGARDRLVYDVVPFDQIIDVVASGKYDAGLIIHEGQLTFRNQGLNLVTDLGVWWQEKTGLPLPLGGNVVRKDLGKDTMLEVSRLIKESIKYGLQHRQEALDHALKYARDMDVALADKFVGMYVNHWTLDYGDQGRAAVRRLLAEGHRAGVIPHACDAEFVE
jgi:1,4-dihydroxy-6-naphthoate synthase